MKRQILLLTLATVLLTAYSNTAEAQFWKKLFKKEEKKPVRKPRPKPVTPVEKTAPKPSKKKSSVDYPETEMKKRYRVDVLMPLYLDELIKGDKPTFKGRIPDKAISGVDFYEGVKLAADTLNYFGYNIDVYVHDVTDMTATPEALITRRTLDETDLLIGAVNFKEIKPLADFALKNKINFVSALSPSDAGIKDNPYFILMQPTFQTHCEKLKEGMAKKYSKQKPILIYRTSVKMDESAYANFTDVEVADKVLVNTMPLQSDLVKVFSKGGTNVVLMPILDAAYSEKILLQLNEWFPDYNFEVYGMPSWSGMSSLKKADAFPNVGVTYTDAFYFDASTSTGQAVAHSYKKAAGSSKPSEMVFRGYETMFWYAYLLHKYGTIFNEKFKDNGTAPFTRIDIKLQRDKDDNVLYHENKNIYLFRYQSSSYMVEQ